MNSVSAMGDATEQEAHEDRERRDDISPACGHPLQRTIPKRLIIVEPMVMIYLVAGFPMEMIFTQYLYQRVGESMGINVDNLTTPNSSSSDCDIDLNDTNYIHREAVQARTSLWTLYIDMACFLPGFFAFLTFGTMSDRVGRKFLFILPPIGSLYKAILAAAIIKFHLPIWVFFFNVFEYCLGSFDLLQLASLAYLADTTSPRYLAVRMTILQVIVDLTSGLADMGVGVWIRESGYFWPTLFVCCGKTAALLYAIFFIPETITNSTRTRRITSDDFTRTFNMFRNDDGSGRLWKLRLLTFAFVMSYITYNKHALKLVILNNPLCWGPLLFGYFIGYDYGIRSFGTVLVAVVKGCSRLAEEWLLLLKMMFIAPVLGVLSYAGNPMTRAILSRYVGLDEQGALFAGQTVLYRLCLLIGTIEGSYVYSATIFVSNGRTVFFISAASNIIAVICIITFIVKTREERRFAKERAIYETLPTTNDNDEDVVLPVDRTINS